MLLLARLSVTYLSMRPPHSLARLVNRAKSCAIFIVAFFSRQTFFKYPHWRYVWDFFTTVLLVVKIFWFSRLIFEIVSLLSIFHEFQNPQNFEKTLLWFISISFSLLTCLYTIWYFIQFSRYILRATSCDSWWRIRGSNPWPPACKAGALPAELIPHMLVFFSHDCVALSRCGAHVR